MSDNHGHDPIGEYLGEKLATTKERDPAGQQPRWRLSVVKMSGWFVMLVLLVAVGFLVSERWWSSPGGRARVPGKALVEAPVEAVGKVASTVRLVEGEVALVRGRTRARPASGDEILPGDRIETGGDGVFGMSHPAGHTLVVVGEARLGVRGSTATELRVSLERGVLAARAVVQEGYGAALRIEGSNAEVVGRGAVFTVEALERRLERAAVAEGDVLVECRKDRMSFSVERSTVLEMRTWTERKASPDSAALARLAELTEPPVEDDEVESGREEEIAPEPVEIAPEPVEKAPPQELEETEEAEEGQALSAGDGYRQQGKWPEAVDAYLAEAEQADGKVAERALLKAAGICLRKLGETARAAQIVEAYLERFPGGYYLDEALYLGGAIHVKGGSYAKARALYERYLDLYPDGVQAVRVHVALAKILASKLSDCAAAMVHVEAVRNKGKVPAVSAEVEKVAALCGKKGVSK